MDDTTLRLVDGLQHAVPDRAVSADTPPALDRPWSDRFKLSHQPADYQLLDQIWLSPTAAGTLTGAGILGRTSPSNGPLTALVGFSDRDSHR